MFTSSVRLMVPKSFPAAVKVAAGKRYLSASAYIRLAVAEQLKRDGIEAVGEEANQ